MTLRIQCLVIDCHDPAVVAGFWRDLFAVGSDEQLQVLVSQAWDPQREIVAPATLSAPGSATSRDDPA
jgi:hypothetical protein